MEELFTITEAQKILKVSRATLYNWMDTGRLKYVYVGDLRRIPSSSIQQFIDDSTREKEQQKNQEPELLAA